MGNEQNIGEDTEKFQLPDDWRDRINKARKSREEAAERVKERTKIQQELEESNRRKWESNKPLPKKEFDQIVVM